MELHAVLLFFGLILSSLATIKYLVFYIKPNFSHLRQLQGPKRGGLILGNLKQIGKLGELGLWQKWEKEFGKVFVFKVFFNIDRIYISDLRAVNHVLTHSSIYQKPEQSRVLLSNLLGEGILVTEGDIHRKQRRVLNPCFGPSFIRDLTPVFFDKAIKLQHILENEIASAACPKRIDILMWLSRVTLDIIGAAGFNFELNSLDINGDPNELARAFRVLLQNDVTVQQLVRILVPFTRFIKTEYDRKEARAKETMLRIGAELLQQRKRGEFGVGTEKDEKSQRDLLTVLVKANQDPDIPESQRMDDDEVIAQVPTFLVAGHETTSTETAWALFALASRPQMQSRLRAELLSCNTPTPSMDTLASLPYLDAVVRETLRLYPAVPGTARIAMQDDVIPLNEDFVDKNGAKRSTLSVKEGDGIFIPISAINQSTETWGADAMEFNPDRWSNIPDSSSSIPGVFSNVLSFLGGARSCIGYRFAVIEMKVLLFTLVRTFEFELGSPLEDYEPRSMVVTRIYLKSEPKAGAQLPLLMRKYHDGEKS